MAEPRAPSPRRRGGASESRRAAFEVLQRLERRRSDPATLLHDPRHDGLSPPDRDLANEIVYGVLRWRNRLDFVLRHHSKRALEGLDPRVLGALRIGLYQIRHLDRVPERAAVDESVRLAKDFGAGWGASYVNAVLRNALRHPQEPRLPRREDSPVDFLTVTLSHPEWLSKRYLDRLGLARAEARCLRQNQPPPIYLRVSNRVSLDDTIGALAAEGIRAEINPSVERCLRVIGGRPRESALYEAGKVFVQDAGSQLVPWLFELAEDDEVLDLCGAPGGKATSLGERVPRGFVLALDRRPRRSVLMRDLAARLGLTNLWIVTADGRETPTTRRFRHILLDVPCTSLGTLGRNPDIKWRVTEVDLKRRASVQRELIGAASNLLAPGGRLVYATFSSEPEENEEVISAFLAETPGFRLVPADSVLPPEARHFVSPSGTFETFPERDDTDGYFAAILTRDS